MTRFIINQTSVEQFIDPLLMDDPYSFSRFGDGEWNAIFRKSGANCDGHEYFPEMGARLEQAILNPEPYRYGIQNLALRTQGFEIKELTSHVHIPWWNADVFHKAFAKGQMGHMVQALKTKKVCLVGPAYLKDDRLKFLRTGSMIEVPGQNCYTANDEVINQIIKKAVNNTADVFAFSASMMANVAIHELFSIVGHDKWLIDFGSVWDPCVDNPTRQVHKTYSQELIERNLG